MIDIEEIVRLSQVLNMYDYYLGEKGRNGRYKCPFNHAESNKNVSIKNGIWHCFSCGIGGDIVKLVAKMYNLKYIEAAKKIAMDFGLLNLLDPTDEDLKEIERRKKQRADDEKKRKDFETQKSEIIDKAIRNERIARQIYELLAPRDETEEELIKFAYSSRSKDLFDWLKVCDGLETVINILTGTSVDISLDNYGLLNKIDYNDLSRDGRNKSSDRLAKLIIKGEVSIDLYGRE